MRTTTSVALTFLLTGACAGSGTTPRRPVGADLEAYCAVAGQPGLDAWIGDVVTLCAPGEDEHEASCRALRARADGTLDPIAMPADAVPVRAMPAGAGVIALLADGRLVRVASSGLEELAAWASDPWIDEQGARVVFVGLPDGIAEWELGAPTVIRSLDLESGVTTLLVDDAEASAPRTIPGSRDVLFTSTATGIASLWIARDGGAAEALTNVGLVEMGPDAVPVPDRDLAFVGTNLVYGVVLDDGTSRLWSLDLATHEARELGTGAWPRPHGAESVIALQTTGDCAAVMPVGGAR